MTRPLTLAALALLLLIPTPRATAQPPVRLADAPKKEPAKEPGKDQKKESGSFLDRKLPEVNFDAIPLKDVLSFLGDITGGSFLVDWPAFGSQHVTRDRPVTLKLKNAPLGIVLRKVFVAAGAPKDPTVKLVKDETVSIKPTKGVGN